MRDDEEARFSIRYRPARLSAVPVTIGVLAALAGCASVGPDFHRPEAQVPAKWSEAGDPAFTTQTAPDADWWKAFNDPTLDRLVDMACHQNLPLQVAGLRMVEARARLGIATGRQYPQVQAVSGSAMLTRLSDSSTLVSGLTSPTGAAPGRTEFIDYQAGFDAIWEVDFWGKYRRGVEAETANLLASAADYSQALVSLTAEVARTYATMRTFEALIALAQDNVRVQQESLQVAESRFKNGATSEVDVTQATVLLESTRATIPQLQASLQQTRNALGTLLGRPFAALQADLLSGPSAIPAPPASVTVGMPAELLRRRADVRSAELMAAAQCARIGVAKADLYPSFALFGTIGLQATSGLDQAFNLGDSLFYAVGPRVRWPFLDYGRTKNTVRVEDARFEQLLVGYQDTVLRATQEVEDALSSFQNAQQAATIEERAVAAANRSVTLALAQYREGSADYERVLDSQRSLLQEQNGLTHARSSAAIGLIAVYKALGGGWDWRPEQTVTPAIQDEMKKRTDWGTMLTEPNSAEQKQPEPAPR
jgi:NodT family efflux transporter outer membrane factor (OMF) lipoprotein